MSDLRNVSRRDFVKTTGLAGSALVLGVNVSWLASCSGERGSEAFEPNVYISVHEDGSVRLTVHRSEMGQGVRTSCAMLLADELDVDWSAVEIHQAVGHPRYGNQNTDGSRSIRTQWEPLRRAGAAAREMLVAAAAAGWGVPADECSTEQGQVLHATSGRRSPYGRLVARAAALPVPENPTLKSAADFTIIGHPTTHVDVNDLVTGTAVYGWDVEVPDMLYASLERSPTVKGSIRGYSADAARAVPGVIDVVELEPHPGGLTNASIAVVAEDTWPALEGRKALQPRWDPGPLAAEDSERYREHLEQLAARPGELIRQEGDVARGLAAATRILEATYHGPYLVHAPMEPPVCTAVVEADRCEVWAPTQAPQWARREIAELLGLEEDNVTVNVTLLGGGFGRKSKPDFILEAVALAAKVKRPVKVSWSREDEVRHGFYRAQNCQKLRAGIDRDGRVTTWHHRTVFPSIGWRFEPDGIVPSEGQLGQGFTNIPYRIPNIRLEAGQVPSDLRIGWWRSVNHTFHAFAVGSFMDELAHALERDPVRFHLDMLGEPRILEFSDRDRQNPYKFDTGRLSHTIEQVADMGLWGRTVPERHGVGFAAHYSFLTYVAMAMHVSLDGEGRVRVHEVDCAVDCGQVVNPDTVKAQMEGGVVFGLTAALYDAITVKDSVVQQGNFDDYPMLRIGQAPTVNVRIVESRMAPTGVGEPPVPPVAPALCNAIFAAGGRRIRELPLSKHNLA